jgi:2-C-methyl-D-erythritol 4-phosphate cytidylyltransferase/2-C-methyl-D-erythritol 2,4-cyclodiphosphate synthase
VPTLHLADTVKRIEAAIVLGTVDRTGLAVAQTPQAFAAPALRAALDGDLEGATDCSALVERRGGRIRAVEGDVRLLKVTTASDLAVVEQLLAGA